MDHQDEYHDSMVALLELIWGEGFLSPGGAGNVARLVGDLDLDGRRVLDIGCGIGGPAFVLAGKYGARVVGTDLEAPLIERARERARSLGLGENTEFLTVTAGPLDFADESFDMVMSCGAFTQTPDKVEMFEECRRVLRPGGTVSCYEWMKCEGEYSPDMHYFFKMEGLTYAMETLEAHAELLSQAGFVNVEVSDDSDWYRRQARAEYELLLGELNEPMVKLIGQDDADYFVENWRAMVVVCENGEMRQGYCRARKPD